MKVIKLPTPSSITYNWNFGSLLGVNLSLQILTGVIMTMYYSSSLSDAFESVLYMMNNVNNGWTLRTFHANGATFFFIFLYLHIARAMFYKSFLKSPITWSIGVAMYLMYMATAFLGYVLPWGQMSYWGATVITNLLSAIPYMGAFLVEWIWGGFSVSSPTLTRFFSLHYSLPLISLVLIMTHLIFLHETGSSNPIGLGKNSDKVMFHPYFTIKDVIGFILFLIFLFVLSFKLPNYFLDSDNFLIANPMITPEHIQPEWYFLFAYAILRSVPSKFGGVVSLLMSIFVLFFLPYFCSKKNTYTYKMLCIFFFVVFLILTFIGAMPVEHPYSLIGLFFSFFYFSFFSMFFLF